MSSRQLRRNRAWRRDVHYSIGGGHNNRWTWTACEPPPLRAGVYRRPAKVRLPPQMTRDADLVTCKACRAALADEVAKAIASPPY